MSGGGIAGSQAQIHMAGGGKGEGSYWVMQEEVPYGITMCVELWPLMTKFQFVMP